MRLQARALAVTDSDSGLVTEGVTMRELLDRTYDSVVGNRTERASAGYVLDVVERPNRSATKVSFF